MVDLYSDYAEVGQLSDRTLKTYTGGIPQRLDTGVYSAVTAKTNTALWQRKRAQRCDSSGSDSAEITMCTLL